MASLDAVLQERQSALQLNRSEAIKSLIDQKIISLGSHKGSEHGYIDKVDLAIRVVLNMCRQMKQRVSVRNKVMRSLGARERSRVTLVLERLQLPPELMEEEEDALEPESSLGDKSLALVQVMGPEATEPSEQLVPFLSKSVQPSKAAQPSTETFGLLALPSVFQRLSQNSCEVSKPGLMELPEKKRQGLDRNEEALLAEALAYVPSQVHQSGAKAKRRKATNQSKSGEKKKPKAKSQANKKGKKKQPKKKPSTAKAQQKLQPEKKPAAPKTKAKEVEASSTLSLDDVPVAGTGSFIFESITYGKCKLERYKDKSYLRHLVDGKYKNIIGSCAKGYHAECCRGLAPYVAQGKSSDELYQIREKILEDLMDVE
eukprot:Skav231857  [mRNA]  locus=scaffold2307:146277:147737:- [translate_table: standard]